MQKRVFIVAGYNTVSLGSGRSEFNPKKENPGLAHYIQEAGRKVLARINGAEHVDESVIGNFIASRFNNQAHLAAFIPSIDEKLKYKPAIRVEGACASGGLAVMTGVKSILAGTADVVLIVGVEVQNTVKAMYGADFLAQADYYPKRKDGHAYFFPGKFSDRAGAYASAYGEEYMRKGLAQWYVNCVENARLCETAQEFENKSDKLMETGLLPPDGSRFVDHLNYTDCSKVSDGASAIAIVSEEGLKRTGIAPNKAIELVGFAQAEDNIMEEPVDPLELSTTKAAVNRALSMAGIGKEQLATVETHDCFTIAGVLATEAIGFAAKGHGAAYVAEGNTARNGTIPFNTTGGLIAWGHPTGATGVHQVVTIWEQLTGQAGQAQIKVPDNKPYGMTVNMGGNDKTVVSMVFKKCK
ncbi:hypothetical protein KEM09_02910 [Carboxylicivirga mesophila]|uniref:propanoyl-CoA C-acyltransferase n=1 Tax=Carboxylicivirga mesophila TaxID=1166478 RepID=A0ABS5K5S8_9BACT|nr:beta-ketoacyl synthase N-terminal-like domain-containing protein [Carboxylicivirga mesophila]MBS2210330.1 hypothetical protein [Carboxylicivirga mesophila]